MRLFPALAFTDGEVWRPEIGDPTVMGWVTVAAYFTVAVLCLGCAWKAKLGSSRTEFLFWSGLAVLLLLLGINKQLDLQTWLTLTGRRMARAQGWYEYRRPVQLLFVVMVALAAVGGFAAIWRFVREHRRELWISLLGLVLLLAFVIVRAASFHHVDNLISFHFAGVRMNWVLELGAIGLIALGAWRREHPNKDGLRGIDSSANAALS
jgi:hypothetical protein